MKATISSLLGFTHLQMAMLLRVTRSQWSMYESGKRNLPLRALQILAEMFGFLKFEGKGDTVIKIIAEQEEAAKMRLERDLKENEFQLMLIKRQIEKLERIYNKNLTVIRVTDYLSTQPRTQAEVPPELLMAFASDASRTLRKSGLAQLTALQVKLEVLEAEKTILSKRLKK